MQVIFAVFIAILELHLLYWWHSDYNTNSCRSTCNYRSQFVAVDRFQFVNLLDGNRRSDFVYCS